MTSLGPKDRAGVGPTGGGVSGSSLGGGSRGLSDRAGNYGRPDGFSKKLKDKKKETTSGTTGDPDNPTLDELREGIYEPVEDRFPVEGKRRKRTVLSLDGRFDDLKRFLGG